MNNRGQVVFVAFMLGISIFVLAIAFAPAIQEASGEARNATIDGVRQLDCDNSSIDDFKKGSCILVDATPAYFIGGLLGIVGIVLLAKILI